MDERSFDKLIKEKLAHYHQQDFDENAFDKFKARLDSQQPAPTYNRYIGPVSVAAIALLTLVNFAITFSDKEPAPDHALQKKIDSLLVIVNQQKTQPQPVYLQRTNVVARQPETIKVESHSDSITSRPAVSHVYNSTLPAIDVPVAVPNVKFVFVEAAAPKQKTDLNRTSIKIMNKLEQHYFSGLGINIAPQIGVGLLRYNSPGTSIMPGASIAVDWILSPHISIETDAQFSVASHTIATNSPEIQHLKNNSYGELSSVIQIDNLLRTSALFKYRQWVTQRDQLILKAGLSNYTALGGKYNLRYSKGPVNDPDDRDQLTQVGKIDGLRNFAILPSIGIGFSRQLKHSQKIEVVGFYEPALRFNKNNVQTFGIQAALWFRVR